MSDTTALPLIDRLVRIAPFDLLPQAVCAALAPDLRQIDYPSQTMLLREGDTLDGLYVIERGSLEVRSTTGEVLSHRGPGDVLGERALLRDGRATLNAYGVDAVRAILIPAAQFRTLLEQVPDLNHWFERGRPATTTTAATDAPEEEGGAYASGLTALHVTDLMVRDPIACQKTVSVSDAARLMRDHKISSVLVKQGEALAGILTVHDLSNKVLAEGKDGTCPVHEIMTPNPLTISPEATGLDALVMMAQHGVNHLPVFAADGGLIGMIARTDLFRRQAATASHLIAEIVSAQSVQDMTRTLAYMPRMLSHLVASGVRPHDVCRRITGLTDAATRRLLLLGEERFGPPPVPYLWAACGSQGRQEQTGVSDQDNCLILDDAFAPAHDAYFKKLAQFVSDGLDTLGFVYCPGDMMATNPRWRQPKHAWRKYFADWIAAPDKEAQMLASVMFDLRPIAGEVALFDGLQEEVLEMASGNSIFVSHMIGNALGHTPPLGLFRGFATIRAGEHKNTIDLKHAGVVPIIDLGRIYALKGHLTVQNTRARIIEAVRIGAISQTGGHDLLDAYDLIAAIRLNHQAAQLAKGVPSDNFMAPGRLSELERNHLRDAFMVVRTMQSALGQLAGAFG